MAHSDAGRRAWQLCCMLAVLLAGCGTTTKNIPTASPAPRSAPAEPRVAGVDPAGLINRVTWGINPSTLHEAETSGLPAWLARQLHPGPATLPEPVQAVIDTMDISRVPVEQLVSRAEQQRLDGRAASQDPDARIASRQSYQQNLNQLARETATRSLLRAIHSPNQLQEQMTWFWMNHFSVFQGKANVRAMLADYEERAIRPHVLGRFRDLLGASAHHPAMLRFLDNDQNAAGRINENYARELMELHTLGVDGGYTQQDVQELARVLTGVGINQSNARPRMRAALEERYVRRGLFEFNPARHDFGSKTLLGQQIAGRGLDELEQALDLLAAHPATARFVSRKLATYFVSDNPPAALVDQMARRFSATGGDIAATLQLMFESRALQESFGRKFKDPMAWMVSAVRLSFDKQPVVNVAPLLVLLNRMGEPLYGRRTPDGYPLEESAWTGSGQMNARFEAARALAAGPPALLRAEGGPAERLPPPRLADSPVVKPITASLSGPSRLALAEARTPLEWNSFFLASPEMMRR